MAAQLNVQEFEIFFTPSQLELRWDTLVTKGNESNSDIPKETSAPGINCSWDDEMVSNCWYVHD